MLKTNAHKTNAHKTNAHKTNAHKTNAHKTTLHITNASTLTRKLHISYFWCPYKAEILFRFCHICRLTCLFFSATIHNFMPYLSPNCTQVNNADWKNIEPITIAYFSLFFPRLVVGGCILYNCSKFLLTQSNANFVRSQVSYNDRHPLLPRCGSELSFSQTTFSTTGTPSVMSWPSNWAQGPD